MADDPSPQQIERVKTAGPDPKDRADIPRAAAVARPRAGFFTVYKRGQGYWTRMGTLFAAVLIGLLTAEFIHAQVYAQFGVSTITAAAIGGGFLLVFALFAWRLMNKPGNVDFLVATDSEMKKVNWTSRRELIGSTKVVVIFVILIALILFLLDIFFGYFFHLIGVLEGSPFG